MLSLRFPQCLPILVGLIVCPLISCSKSTSEDKNDPPSVPELVSPANQSESEFITAELRWTANDPEGATLTYNVFFGSTNPPAQVSVQQAENLFYVPQLEYGRDYYWRVVAWDDMSDSSVSPTWTFSTSAEPQWTQFGPEIVGAVRSLTKYKGKVVAGGASRAGRSLLAIGDGTSWQEITDEINCGSEFDCGVSASIEFQDRLVVGGNFVGAGDIESPDCMFWDEPVWLSSASQFEHTVTEFLIRDNVLYAGSAFWRMGNEVTGGVFVGNGHGWDEVGTGIVNGRVNAMIEFDGDFLIAGDMGAIPGIQIPLARLEGDIWQKVGPEISGEINALCEYQGKLVAGGNFIIFDTEGLPAGMVAAWDGSQWSAVGEWVGGGSVNALLVYKDRLVAAGEFDEVGGITRQCIAVWDGHVWSSLGPAFTSEISALTEYEGTLLVGGHFRGVRSLGVAQP